MTAHADGSWMHVDEDGDWLRVERLAARHVLIVTGTEDSQDDGYVQVIVPEVKSRELIEWLGAWVDPVGKEPTCRGSALTRE